LGIFRNRFPRGDYLNILFIEPELRTDKLGFLYLSSIMKQAGHAVELQVGEETLFLHVASFKPDFIMYSVQTGNHNWYIEINKKLKYGWRFKSVFGGAHFTFYPEKHMHEESIDYIVQGPGEKVILDIIDGNIKEKFIKGPLFDNPNDFPDPDRELLYSYKPLADAGIKRFIASRDCPNACTYCFNHIYHRIYKDQKQCFFKKKSVSRTIREIVDVKNKWPLEVVYFNDDDLCEDKEWLEEFLPEYKEKVNLPFCGSARANHIDERTALHLSVAGCTFLNMALESAVPETQKMLRRGNVSNEQIFNACRILNFHSIKVRLQNIIGLPVDDPFEDAIQTLKMNQEINPYDSWCAILQPYPGTDIFKTCRERNLIEEDFTPVNFFEHTQLKINCASEINTLHKLWYFAVKYKIDPELIRILCKQPLTKEVSKLIQDYRWSQTAENVYKGKK
jgi:radical SAM superfamily enzyme YgiQ (UPF0313 family)